MENLFIELAAGPDWSNDKCVAYDLDNKALYGADVRKRGERIFFPRSQVVDKNGKLFVSEWILNEKKKELVNNGFSEGNVSVAFSCITGQNHISKPMEVGIDVSKLIEWFDTAAENLKYPKVEFPNEVSLSRKGGRARNPGEIEVTNGAKWGDPARRWYGTIRRDGHFTPSRDCTEDVTQVVTDFAKSPHTYIAEAQKLAGNCCFCRGELTTERSRAAGYGPTCAKNWELPW